MFIVAAANFKGGVGKSTTSLELAYLYSKDKKKVLVIDADPQCGATSRTSLNTTIKATLKAVLEGYVDVNDAIYNSDNYDLIAGDERLKEPGTIFNIKDDLSAIKDIISELDYDIVIIDVAPGDNILYDMCCFASDYIIVPVDASPESIEKIANMKKKVDELNSEYNTNIQFLGTLLCNVSMQFGKPSSLYKGRYKELLGWVKELTGIAPFENYIYRHDIVGEANNYKTAINELDPTKNAAQDYLAFYIELNEKINKLNNSQIAPTKDSVFYDDYKSMEERIMKKTMFITG